MQLYLRLIVIFPSFFTFGFTFLAAVPILIWFIVRAMRVRQMMWLFNLVKPRDQLTLHEPSFNNRNEVLCDNDHHASETPKGLNE